MFTPLDYLIITDGGNRSIASILKCRNEESIIPRATLPSKVRIHGTIIKITTDQKVPVTTYSFRVDDPLDDSKIRKLFVKICDDEFPHVSSERTKAILIITFMGDVSIDVTSRQRALLKSDGRSLRWSI